MRLGYDSIVQESIALTLIENKMLIIQSNDDVVTVSNIHRTGKRERSAAIDEPMKRPDPGSVLVRSLKDRYGTLSSL